MKARIGPIGKLDCLHSKKKVLTKNGSFLTWADAEPSAPVAYDLLGLYYLVSFWPN